MSRKNASTGCAHVVLKEGRVYVFAEAHIAGSLATATDRLIGEIAEDAAPEKLGRLIRDAAQAKTVPVSLEADNSPAHPVLSAKAKNRKRRGVMLVSTAERGGALEFHPMRYDGMTGYSIEEHFTRISATASDKKAGAVALAKLRESQRANDPLHLE